MPRKLTEVPVGPDREAYWPLLLLADEAVAAIEGYYQRGTLFGFGEPQPIGHVLVIPVDDTTAELKSVAVVEARQRQGVGQRMLAAVCDVLRTRGYRRAVVGTGNAGVGQLAFYQRAGFRMWKIERDFFSPERGYVDPIEEHGIRILDMVWLDRDL